MTETGYAKLNLALHIRGRRADGFWELETIFAFADRGDELAIAHEGAPPLTLDGPLGGAVEAGPANLVARAAQLFSDLTHRPAPPLRLTKRMPVAGGIGGGSADAGATLRLLARLHGLEHRLPELQIASAQLGADVPACVLSRTALGRGTGTELTLLDAQALCGTPVLLVNPGVQLSTGAVFAAHGGGDRAALPRGDPLTIALAGRNDLEAPALQLQPAIADVLAALQAQEPLLARMSGSGATCFALFRSASARDAAAQSVAGQHPDWWLLSAKLR